MTRHGMWGRKGDDVPPGKTAPTGKFGRMFPELRPLVPPIEALEALGKAMRDEDSANPKLDNPEIPAGYTYLGQFIDHDITFDTTTLKETLVDPLAIHNFRTPALDLDSVYGAGPLVQPYLYDLPAAFDPDKPARPQERFEIGRTNKQPGGGDPTVKPNLPHDLPRSRSGVALIGDPRNDENLIVAQLHLAFIKFHNKIVEKIRKGEIEQQSPIRKTPFEEARDLVIWHYQWIVLHDFLRRILDTKVLDDVIKNGRSFYKFGQDAFIPVEFSVAAYRLGHSMVREVYDYNRVFNPGNIPATLDLLFNFTARSGRGVPIPSDWIIDWRRFFDFKTGMQVGLSRKLDPFLVEPLASLPGFPPGENSLAVRNLKRGRSLGLPSGQSIARYMGVQPLRPAEIAEGQDGQVAKQYKLHVESPLWYYILKEAQVQANGKHLGAVGSRIVAEVFVGLLQGDSSSFLVRNPHWAPTLGKTPGTFNMTDLLEFVDELSPIDDPQNKA